MERDNKFFIEQIASPTLYSCYNMGEGMFRCQLKSNWKETYLINTHTQTAYKIIDSTGNILAFTENDIDFDSVDKMKDSQSAYHLWARYYFGINKFGNGISLVTWTLRPDGQYFADEDGYGMEDNDQCREQTLKLAGKR